MRILNGVYYDNVFYKKGKMMFHQIVQFFSSIPFFSSVAFGIIAMVIVGSSWCLVGLVMGAFPSSASSRSAGDDGSLSGV